MTKAEILELLAPYPDDMPVFYYDRDDARPPGHKYDEPEIRIEQMAPFIENGRRFVSSKSRASDVLIDAEQDGDPFDAIVIL